MEPSFWESSGKQGGIIRGKRVGLPYDWGTEVCAWNTDKLSFKYGELSYASMWNPQFVQKVTCRSHSVFFAQVSTWITSDKVGRDVRSEREQLALQLFNIDNRFSCLIKIIFYVGLFSG